MVKTLERTAPASGGDPRRRCWRPWGARREVGQLLKAPTDVRCLFASMVRAAPQGWTWQGQRRHGHHEAIDVPARSERRRARRNANFRCARSDFGCSPLVPWCNLDLCPMSSTREKQREPECHADVSPTTWISATSRSCAFYAAARRVVCDPSAQRGPLRNAAPPRMTRNEDEQSTLL